MAFSRNSFACLLAPLWLLTAAAPTVFSQTVASLHLPVLGHLFDAASGALRTIEGFPGAAMADASLPAQLRWRQAHIAPSQQYALAVPEQDSRLWLVPLGASPSLSRAMDEIAPLPREVVFSPSGALALVVSDDILQLMTGLPDRPTKGRSMPVSALGETPGFLALAEDGTVAMTGNPARLIDPAGQILPLPVDGAVTAFSFQPGSAGALVVIAGQRRVIWLRHPGLYPEALEWGEADGIRNPVAAELSGDRRRLFVLEDGGSLLVIDTSGESSTMRLACECVPNGLVRLNGEDVFLLNGSPNWPSRTLRVLDGARLRIVFVPVERGNQ